MRLDIREVSYHRNGISGNGFHVVQFKFKEDGVSLNMIGIVFEEPGNVAVFDRQLLSVGIAEFIKNSWRGDRFEPALRRAIKRYEK